MKISPTKIHFFTYSIFLFFAIIFNNSYAQNLILNGDFEDYNSCPIGYSQLNRANHWRSPSYGLTAATPDYFNVCASPLFVGVPYNFGSDYPGSYQPAFDGNAYTGIFIYTDYASNYREYIEGNISSPLVQNSTYYFEMQVGLSDFSQFTTDDIAVYFSDTLIDIQNYNDNLPFMPQLVNTLANFPDSSNWVTFSGYYTAHGGESFIVIGNFKDDITTNSILVNSTPPLYPASYIFIDGVSLTLLTSIPDLNQSISVYPTLFNSEGINIRTSINYKLKIEVYNSKSNKILIEQFYSELNLNGNDFIPGVYFYKIFNSENNQLIKKGKLIRY